MRVFGRVERIEHGIIAAIDRKIVIFGIDRKSIYDFFFPSADLRTRYGEPFVNR